MFIRTEPRVVGGQSIPLSYREFNADFENGVAFEIWSRYYEDIVHFVRPGSNARGSIFGREIFERFRRNRPYAFLFDSYKKNLLL